MKAEMYNTYNDLMKKKGEFGMAVKTTTEVVIGGKICTLSGYEEEEYLQKVAAYINAKINELDELQSTRLLPPMMKGTLIQINLADDYFKAKAQIEKLENNAIQKDKEIYDLKHDIITAQIMAESLEERILELEAKNKELLLNKTRLETALEEALLEKDKSKKKR